VVHQVLLLIPWLAECEQRIVYPDGITFRAPAEQEDWIRAWVEKRTGFPSNFDIRFYPGEFPLVLFQRMEVKQ
jgi:digalactosyldiacylglycerol synthase